MTEVIRAMRQRLAALDPQELDVVDESAAHAGHAGARGGGGHYRMRIVSAQFAGKRTLERHRLIFDALGPMMRREIHALSIEAAAPEEN